MEEVSNKQQTPRVSVIMPAYNAGRFVEAAVCSVVAQTMTKWELLVIDDGSSDDTCRIVEKLAQEDHRIQLLRNEKNLGVSNTRNRGIALAKGAYIAFLDSDDVWHPQKLEKQLAQMEASGADICYCSYAIVDETGKKAKADYLVPEQVSFSELLKENVIGCSTVLLRREALQNHCFGSAYYHEDYVLWLTLLREDFRACGCAEVLSDWRLIANSRSFNKFRSAAFRWKIYREYLNLNLRKSLCAFAGYAMASLRKYR